MTDKRGCQKGFFRADMKSPWLVKYKYKVKHIMQHHKDFRKKTQINETEVLTDCSSNKM
jgi:hypothetical protein